MNYRQTGKSRKTFFGSFLALALALFFTSCKTTSFLLRDKYTEPQVLPVELLCPQEINWQPVEINGKTDSNFSLLSYIIHEENVEWKCLKIDLDAENLEIIAAPYNKDLGKRFFFKGFF